MNDEAPKPKTPDDTPTEPAEPAATPTTAAAEPTKPTATPTTAAAELPSERSRPVGARWWSRRVPLLATAATLLFGIILGAGVVAVGAAVIGGRHHGDDRARSAHGSRGGHDDRGGGRDGYHRDGYDGYHRGGYDHRGNGYGEGRRDTDGYRGRPLPAPSATATSGAATPGQDSTATPSPATPSPAAS
ncbi:hypothetical protein GCM10010517_45600 [Streptosporangium fragile]|uniref:Uncharacterized protein n=1 Tax=Streptosporangium fragile TaxID=46186 RepID=A0ABN3W1J4_9ACTN